MSVVDVILTTGQSQMVGLGQSELAPRCNPEFCWEWDGGLPLKTIEDPVSCTTAPYKALDGSPIPAFANRFTGATGRPLMIVRAAVGGSALLGANSGANGDWSETGDLFNNSVDRYLEAIDDLTSLGHTVGRVHVIWSQGYSDAVQGHDLESYGDATANLVSRWRTALSSAGLQVYIELMYAPAAAPNNTVKTRCLDLRAQQLIAVDETDGLEIGFQEGETYSARHWLNFDQLHYNQAGLNYMGRAYAGVMIDDLLITPAAPEVSKIPSSLAFRLLAISEEPIPKPIWLSPGTYSFIIPPGVTSADGQCEGAGGSGGGGGVGVKGGAGGGGAYASQTFSVTPGETLTITVGQNAPTATGAGVTGGFSQILRNTGSVVLCKASGGIGGTVGSPTGDGAGGATASCVGTVKTAGQAGGVSAQDNGGNGAAPLGGSGGLGTGLAGANPGGGGGGGAAGPSNPGGGSGAGYVKIVLS